jgi:hypothetical protein
MNRLLSSATVTVYAAPRTFPLKSAAPVVSTSESSDLFIPLACLFTEMRWAFIPEPSRESWKSDNNRCVIHA